MGCVGVCDMWKCGICGGVGYVEVWEWDILYRKSVKADSVGTQGANNSNLKK